MLFKVKGRKIRKAIDDLFDLIGLAKGAAELGFHTYHISHIH
jgi:hypothetical protein